MIYIAPRSIQYLVEKSTHYIFEYCFRQFRQAVPSAFRLMKCPGYQQVIPSVASMLHLVAGRKLTNQKQGRSLEAKIKICDKPILGQNGYLTIYLCSTNYTSDQFNFNKISCWLKNILLIKSIINNWYPGVKKKRRTVEALTPKTKKEPCKHICIKQRHEHDIASKGLL